MPIKISVRFHNAQTCIIGNRQCKRCVACVDNFLYRSGVKHVVINNLTIMPWLFAPKGIMDGNDISVTVVLFTLGKHAGHPDIRFFIENLTFISPGFNSQGSAFKSLRLTACVELVESLKRRGALCVTAFFNFFSLSKTSELFFPAIVITVMIAKLCYVHCLSAASTGTEIGTPSVHGLTVTSLTYSSTLEL